MKDIIFDVDKFIDLSMNQYVTQTHRSVQRVFVDKIVQKAGVLNINEIITNGNIALTIMDFLGLRVTSISTIANNTEPFPFGNIGNITIFLDPLQKWNDNYLKYVFHDDLMERKLKLKAIEKTITSQEKMIKFGLIYTGYVIDTKRILL